MTIPQAMFNGLIVIVEFFNCAFPKYFLQKESLAYCQFNNCTIQQFNKWLTDRFALKDQPTK